jgi:hypothetical protein
MYCGPELDPKEKNHQKPNSKNPLTHSKTFLAKQLLQISKSEGKSKGFPKKEQMTMHTPGPN